MYGILVTVFKAIGTEVFRRDVMKCGVSIRNMVLKYWMTIINLTNTILGLSCNKITWQAVENVVHNLVFVLMVAIAILIPSGLLGYGVYKLARYHRDYLWDKITLEVVLISIAVVVNFADAIKVLLTVNCATLVIGIQVLYVGVRNLIEVVRKSRRIMGRYPSCKIKKQVLIWMQLVGTCTNQI